MYRILNKEHLTVHLQYTHSGTSDDRKYEELSYFKNQKMCDPIPAIMLKMRPHGSQSNRENAAHSHWPPPNEEEPPPPQQVLCIYFFFQLK